MTSDRKTRPNLGGVRHQRRRTDDVQLLYGSTDHRYPQGGNLIPFRVRSIQSSIKHSAAENICKTMHGSSGRYRPWRRGRLGNSAGNSMKWRKFRAAEKRRETAVLVSMKTNGYGMVLDNWEPLLRRVVRHCGIDCFAPISVIRSAVRIVSADEVSELPFRPDHFSVQDQTMTSPSL